MFWSAEVDVSGLGLGLGSMLVVRGWVLCKRLSVVLLQWIKKYEGGEYVYQTYDVEGAPVIVLSVPTS